MNLNTPEENAVEQRDDATKAALGTLEQSRAFTDLLRTIAGGLVHERITKEQAAIVRACRAYLAKGRLDITVTYTPKGYGDDMQMDVQFKVKASPPTPGAGGGTLFVTKGGALVEHDPNQGDMWPVQVDPETGEIRA